MSDNKILKDYVSPIDQFINNFDQQHPKLSQSQLQEKAKHQRIASLRDNANRSTDSLLPEDF